MLKLFFHLGQYSLFIKRIFARPIKFNLFFKQVLKEIDSLGIGSIGIVFIISIFMGAVITLQSAYGIESPFIPKYLIGFLARESMLLEFSSTVVCLIFSGIIGSKNAYEIGTIKITEQIDALEIMGVNSASYLILPKIIGFVLFIPILVVFSMAIGILGGWLAGVVFAEVVSEYDFLYGLRYEFRAYYISYSVFKAAVFAFFISSISAYQGYYTKNNSLEVGRASTKAVVYSSITILLFNLLLTQLLLA